MLMSRPSQQQDDTYKEQHYLGCWKQVVDNYSNTFLDYDCYMNTTMHSIVCGYTRCWLRMIEMGMIEDTHDRWLDQEEEYMQEQREFYQCTILFHCIIIEI